MEIRGNTLIDILKWNIYAPIIYLRADKAGVDPGGGGGAPGAAPLPP